MTLAESKKVKMMKIKGTIGRVDLTGLWFKLYSVGNLKMTAFNGKTIIEFKGDMDQGLYALREIVTVCEVSKTHCRLEITHDYE